MTHGAALARVMTDALGARRGGQGHAGTVACQCQYVSGGQARGPGLDLAALMDVRRAWRLQDEGWGCAFGGEGGKRRAATATDDGGMGCHVRCQEEQG